jgi:hypothetical protein
VVTKHEALDPNALPTFLLIIAILCLPGVYAQIKRYQLDHSDHSQILAACRELLLSRDSYRNDREKWITAEKDDVVILRPIPSNVPEAIRKLHPSVIFIHGD